MNAPTTDPTQPSSPSPDAPAPGESAWDSAIRQWGGDPRTSLRWTLAIFVLLIVAFAVPPLWNAAHGLRNKDYNLWYRTGGAALHDKVIYPTDNRPFPFMYPPSCAAMLAIASSAGEVPLVAILVAATTAAWIASILLSVYLATGRTWGQHPALYIVPSLFVIPFVHDMYLLGQPGLVLLACLLGAFACVRSGRPWLAGALIAVPAAIKAFPILALGYVVYRKQWKTLFATLVFLAVFLLVLPLPMRGAKQTWADLSRWTQGMVMKYDADSIAQRPERSYSFKNQSIIALANRLLRDVPADGERKDGWKVNVAVLDFRTVNAVILLSALAFGGFYVIEMYRAGPPTEHTDSIEVAILLLLIVAFTPLSFDYSYVWLIFPLTVTLHLWRESALGSRTRSLLFAGLTASLLVYSLALPFRRTAQAYGNLLIAGLILVLILGWQLPHVARLAAERRSKEAMTPTAV